MPRSSSPPSIDKTHSRRLNHDTQRARLAYPPTLPPTPRRQRLCDRPASLVRSKLVTLCHHSNHESRVSQYTTIVSAAATSRAPSSPPPSPHHADPQRRRHLTFLPTTPHHLRHRRIAGLVAPSPRRLVEDLVFSLPFTTPAPLSTAVGNQVSCMSSSRPSSTLCALLSV